MSDLSHRLPSPRSTSTFQGGVALVVLPVFLCLILSALEPFQWQEVFVALAIILFGFFAGGFLLRVWYISTYRLRQTLRLIARNLDLDLRETVTKSDLVPFRSFPFFRLTAGARYEAGFLLQGTVDGLNICLLEMAYDGAFPHRLVENAGNTKNQQLLVLCSAMVPLPDFHLVPADNDWDILLPRWPTRLALGDVALTFEENEEGILVHAPDPRAVRHLFRRARAAGMAALAGWTVECQAGNLLLYRHGQEIPSGDILAYLFKAIDITRVLASAAQPSLSQPGRSS